MARWVRRIRRGCTIDRTWPWVEATGRAVVAWLLVVGMLGGCGGVEDVTRGPVQANAPPVHPVDNGQTTEEEGVPHTSSSQEAATPMAVEAVAGAGTGPEGLPVPPEVASATPSIDQGCSFEGMPAIAADGRRVSYAQYTSDPSGSDRCSLEVLRVRDGRSLRNIVVAEAGEGGESVLSSEAVRRAVWQANGLLRRGGFVAMVPLIDHRGVADLARVQASGVTLRTDADSRIVISGRVQATVTAPSHSAHPHCCGLDEDEWGTGSCELGAGLTGAWIAAGVPIMLIQFDWTSSITGCEQEPDYQLVTTAAVIAADRSR